MSNKCKEEMDLYITTEEWKRFISVVDNPMYNLLWRFIVSCGLRISEALPITSKDIDFSTNIVNIATLKRKGHPIFQKDLSPEVAEGFKAITVPPGTPYFTHKGKPLLYKRAYYTFKLSAKKAGLNERYSPHCFRHLTAILVAEVTNGNILKVSRALRHANLNTAERYLHVSPALRKKIAEDIWEKL